MMIVTPSGIAIATDSGRSTFSGDFRPIGKGRTHKVVVVNDHIVVVSVGVTDVTLPDGRIPYAFLDWMEGLKHNWSAFVTVNQVAGDIQRASAATFRGFDTLIEKQIYRRTRKTEDCRMFIQYIVAGYDGSNANIYVVDWYTNWNSKQLIGPRLIQLYPSEEATGPYSYYPFGVTEALDDAETANSYARKYLLSRCQAFRMIEAGRNITFQQALRLAKEFVRIEEDINPSVVFGDIDAIGILPNGRPIDGSNARCGLPKAQTHKPKTKK